MKFNEKTLTLARESRGYTQKQLSEKSGVAQGTISKIELGQLSAPEYLIELFGKALNYPVDFFTQEPYFYVRGHYRSKQSVSDKASKMYLAKMTIVERIFTTLQTAVELPEPNVPSWDIDVDGGSPAMAALFVRDKWKIPKGRITNLTELVEDNGILVMLLDLGEKDGFSTYSDIKYPVIFLNNRRTSDRLRFTLAHELGHLVLHWGRKDHGRDEEQEAHEFASELLMPSQDIQPYLNKLNSSTLTDLKRYWKTSMASIARKAKDLGTITQDQYYYMMKGFSANGYRTFGEPELFEPEKPTILSDIVELYVNDLNYTKQELASLLHLSLDDLDELLFNKAKLFQISRN